VLRLLRVFRIFKLSRYSVEYRALVTAVAASRRKITVFVGFVMLVVLVMGTLMYVVEGPPHGFTSIPVAVYWAISTMATVGFGDLVPKTDLGRAIASVMMLLGWGVLAVPTGIVTAEMARRGPDDGPAVAIAGRGVLALSADGSNTGHGDRAVPGDDGQPSSSQSPNASNSIDSTSSRRRASLAARRRAALRERVRSR
jgi:voltage-gated potassium channel